MNVHVTVKNRRGRPASTDRDRVDAEIIVRASPSVTPNDIAKELGVSSGYVRSRMWFLRRKGFDIPKCEAGRPVEQKKHDDLLQDIVDMRKENIGIREIASELNVSDVTVRQLWDRWSSQKRLGHKHITEAMKIDYSFGDFPSKRPLISTWGHASPTPLQLEAASMLHLLDLKRAGHSPKRTEARVDPEGIGQRFSVTSHGSYCGSPAAMIAELG